LGEGCLLFIISQLYLLNGDEVTRDQAFDIGWNIVVCIPFYLLMHIVVNVYVMVKLQAAQLPEARAVEVINKREEEVDRSEEGPLFNTMTKGRH
jgi:hypothetical protein